jgi:glycosyltransferase involved in cell wall biosynthesis
VVTATARPVVLVVASWYPSVDLPTAGRFVADQVGVIAAAGRFAPLVVSFDPLPLWGSSTLRRREAAAVRSLAAAGLAGAPDAAFVPVPAGAGGDVPVAWLPVPGNAGGVGASDRAADERADVLGLAASAVDAVAGPPALVHAHTGFPDGAAAAAEAQRRGIPLVITEHLSTLGAIARDPLRRARYVAAVTAASRIIAVSERLAAEVAELAPEVRSRIVVIPNMVDVPAFAPDGLAATARQRDELLFVGNRKHSKGIAGLLDAFALARAARPSLRLRLVGGAPTSLDDEWRRQASRLGVADAVDFAPETDRAGVAAAMARADVFVHPSPRETFGVVAAEALVAGLPVVAVDSGGVTEVLGPDVAANGAIVPAGDPQAFAAAILDVLARRTDYRADDLRARAVARFGPASIAERLAEVYAAALAEPLPGAAGNAADLGVRPAASATRTPSVGSPPRRTVVGFDVARAAAVLRELTPEARARTVLVTAQADADALPEIADAITVPGMAERHASLRAMSAVAAAAPPSRRRLALAARPAVLLREARQRWPGTEAALVRTASNAVARAASPGSTIVALDGFDALAAADLVRDGTEAAAPGAGRWLAAVTRNVAGPASAESPANAVRPVAERQVPS